MRTAARWAIRVVLATTALAVIGWLVLYASQWQSRWRAERLYADVMALQMQQSSWADFQRFQARWGAWAYYAGRCQPSVCLYRVDIGGLMTKLPFPDEADSAIFRVRELLETIGLRTTSAMAMVLIEDGTVTHKYYSLSSVSYRTGELDDTVAEGPRLDPYDSKYLHTDHSLRQMKGYMFGVLMTPFEEKQERKRLMHFRFACLTSLRPCSSHREILPDAYAEFEQEKNATSNSSWPHCHVPIWIMARDADAVVLGDVVAAKYVDDLSPDHFDYWAVRIRIRSVLKGKPDAGLNEIDVEVSDDQLSPKHAHQFPYRTLVVTGKLPPRAVFGPFDEYPCGIAQASDVNIKETVRGIKADYAPERSDGY